jgi:hypothetical protein
MGQLDTVFHAFVSWQTVLFCLGIAILTYGVRTVVENVWKGAASNAIWNHVFVRLGPIGTGSGLALVSKSFPWPSEIVGSPLAMAFYGAACGVASAYVYAAFRAWLGAAAQGGFQPAQRLMSKFPSKPAPKPVPAHERPTDPPGPVH